MKYDLSDPEQNTQMHIDCLQWLYRKGQRRAIKPKDIQEFLNEQETSPSE